MKKLDGWTVVEEKSHRRYGSNIKCEFSLKAPSGNITAVQKKDDSVLLIGDYNDSSKGAIEASRIKSAYAEETVRTTAKKQGWRISSRKITKNKIVMRVEI